VRPLGQWLNRAAGIVGVLVLLVAWEAVGRARLLGITFPALSEVLGVLADPSRLALFRRAVAATAEAAGTGYVLGAVLGAAIAVAAHFLPILRPGLDRFAAFANAIPGIALGPILIVTIGRGSAPAALATLHVYFLVYVATTSGLHAPRAAHQDVFSALGSGRVRRFASLEFPAALPTLVTALKLCAPAALLGAILGEWFGAERGLGVLIVNAMQNFQIPLLWSAVVLAAALSLACYGALAVAERAVAERFRG
jgi:NitT/TauT family transport system permease protein